MKLKTLRIPTEIYEQLEEIHDKTGVSISSLIVLAILNSIQKFFQQNK